METWKPVAGFEGLYEVSDNGRVRSCDKFIRHPKGGKRKIKGRIMRFFGKQYHMVSLCTASIRKSTYVHRLVASAFLEIVPGKNVNHKDGNRYNNHVSNLEWVTQFENITHSLLKSQNKKSKHVGVTWSNESKCWRSVTTIKGNKIFIGLFDTEGEAFAAYKAKLSEFNIQNRYL